MFTDKELSNVQPDLFILILKNLPIKTKDIWVTYPTITSSWFSLTADTGHEDCDYALE